MPSLAKMATEAKSKKKTAAPKKPEKKAAPPVSAFKSTEYIEGSDESSAEEDSEDDEEEALKRVAVTTEVNGKTPTGKEDSASESSSEESESDSSSSEEEEDASGSEMSIDKPVEAAKSILKKPQSSTEAAPPAKAQPPPVLNALHPSYKPSEIPSSTPASTIFKKSNLEGKQIWYFTAPAAVPVSAIQKFSLQDVKRGSTAVKVADNEYGFVEDDAADTTYTKILVPSAGESGYKASSKPISKVLHLQLLAKLPGVTTSDPSPNATIPTARPPRQQPKGMKMRFFPIGLPKSHVRTTEQEESEDEEPASFNVPGAIEDSDVEMGDAPSSLKATKRKHKDGEKESKKTSKTAGNEKASIEDEAERKRRKKEKKEKKAKAAAA